MSTLGHFIMTFFIAMLPVLELRGAIPIGTAAGLDPRLALAAAFLGNLVPVPFIVIFRRKIFVWLRTKSEFLDRIVAKMEAKAEKNADKVHKNVPKSLAGCTENGKTPAETISAKKFCRGYVKKSFPEFPGRTDLYSF